VPVLTKHSRNAAATTLQEQMPLLLLRQRDYVPCRTKGANAPCRAIVDNYAMMIAGTNA